MAYGDLKNLITRTASDKILSDKAFNIAKNVKYDRYHIASMIYKFFDKKTSSGAATLARSEILATRATRATRNKSAIKNENMSSKEVAEELNKLIIKKFKKRKVHSPFIDYVRGADLADMQLISKANEGLRFVLCVIDIFSKYTWVIPLKDKKAISITNVFQNILKESNRKPKNIKPANFIIDQ